MWYLTICLKVEDGFAVAIYSVSNLFAVVNQRECDSGPGLRLLRSDGHLRYRHLSALSMGTCNIATAHWAVAIYVVGPTSGPKSYAGPIGKQLTRSEEIPLVKYEPMDCDRPSITESYLSTDQIYLLEISHAA